MKKFIPYNELKFSDNYLFSMIMQKEHICKKVIKTLLNIEVEKIEYINREQSIQPDYSSRGIRADIFVKDSDRIFDLEMQVTTKAELAKRARYYQSMIDLYSLRRIRTDENGEEIPAWKIYQYLQESYIVFICRDDPFGSKIPVYTRKQICAEDPEASKKMDDKTHRVFYNASAWAKCEDPDLRAFLKYIAEETKESELTNEIDNEVTSSRNNELWRRNFMTLEDYFSEMAEEIAAEMAEERAEKMAAERAEKIAEELAKVRAEKMAEELVKARTEKIAEERAKNTARNFLKMGLSPEQVSQGTGLSLEQIMSLAETAC